MRPQRPATIHEPVPTEVPLMIPVAGGHTARLNPKHKWTLTKARWTRSERFISKFRFETIDVRW